MLKLQGKIGSGFGILVLTCLGLTIGTWLGVNALEQRQQKLVVLEKVRNFYYIKILPQMLVVENKVAYSSDGDQFHKQLTTTLDYFKAWRAESNIPVQLVESSSAIVDMIKNLLQEGALDDGRRNVLADRFATGLGGLTRGVEKYLTSVIDGMRADIAAIQLWIKRIAVFLSIVGTMCGIGIAWFISRMITRPVNLTIEKVKEIATGDLSITVPVLTKDEIGSLAQAMNTMTAQLNEMFATIQNHGNLLKVSAVELTDLSRDMMGNSRKVAKDTGAAVVAADGLSRNMESVAQSMEESTSNVASVVTAIEEMTATVGEISRDSIHARSITESAVKEASQASESIEALGLAADEINKVTESITEIADQTNLLALNATIEAARAGEAGKGFAVVAGEIKALAAQTAMATGEIKNRIDGVQESASQVAQVMHSIIEIIGQVSDTVYSITGSVQGQAQTSQAIAGSIGKASVGMNEVNDKISHASSLNVGMAEDLESVGREVNGLLDQCEEVTSAADKQKEIADLLNALSSKFTLS